MSAPAEDPPVAAAGPEEDTPEQAGGDKAASSKAGGSKAGKGEGKITKKMVKEAEQELFQLLLKKKQADRNLIDAEAAIYDFETSYFESSGHEGNIVHGFEGYLNTSRGERRQMHFTEADRIFSQSSATFKRAQEEKIAASLLESESDSDESSARPRGRKGATIRHGGGARQGTPTPGARTTKKIRLSMDAGGL
ncbi:Chromatin modification- protein meaf6 [Coemansia javaensis]|uniref:Chromatin modification-related protein EAF6 n=1 Tax=Coemansia javaensis TaxID=2761396 RepID=A0A9W8LJW0_9FUNG|nr:Chromatin modification- protein meaf6 [Coemansia javaensis]